MYPSSKNACACGLISLLNVIWYVKEDFLIVDSVHLTYKFFEKNRNESTNV